MLYARDMPMYLCRWPSGILSVIEVPEESVKVFRQGAAKDGMTILPMPLCRIDFRWTESDGIELVQVAPHTASFIAKHCREQEPIRAKVRNAGAGGDTK